MLFDNRQNTEADFNRGVSVTALGRAKLVKAGSIKPALSLFLRRYPALDAFVRSPSCRLYQINVKTYVVVTKFQKVTIYKPAP